jgi:chromosome segregation ATPase
MCAMRQCFECKKFYKNKKAISDHKRNTGHLIDATEHMTDSFVPTTLDSSGEFKAKLATQDSVNDEDEFIAELEDSLQQIKIASARISDSIIAKDAEIATLQDSVKIKDELISSLESSLTIRESESASLNEKISFLESDAYILQRIPDLTREAYELLGEKLGYKNALETQPAVVEQAAGAGVDPPVDNKETATVADFKPVEESSIVFREMTGPGWKWYASLGYSIKN